MPGGADEEAGPAGAADGSENSPKGVITSRLAPRPIMADGAHVLQFVADPDALAAQDAVAVALGETGSSQPQLPGPSSCRAGHLGAPGQEQVDDQAAAFQHLLGVGLAP